ncbi:MAG: putative lipid II flippase FtsW [Ignavibacteriae bacterium]|nr:putative lipid II flippase FtsW [Ignavibacteriota bacterium]
MNKAQRNHIDISILVAVLMLMVLSLGVVYSASSTWAQAKFGESDRLLNSHALKILIGLGALFIGMTVDYKKYRKLTKVTVLAAVLLLCGTLVLGGETKGAVRWLRFGGVGLQPSEFAKFALLFHLATMIAVKGDAIKDFKRGFMPMMVWVGMVAGLVMLQPNFSTGAMIVLLSFVMLFMSWVKLLHLLGVGLAALPVLGAYMLSAPYRFERVKSFLLGTSSADQHNYQLFQGIIGFGNGGIFGVGPGESRQRDFFLPESYGDFVFSIVGEEYGFIGTIFIMTLFLVIMLRGFKIAKFARDDYGKMLAVAITSTITLYAVINAGVTLGMLPTTGLPMPFVSYGGSSLLFSSYAVGVLLNISAQTDMHPRATKLPDGVMPLEPQQAVVGQVY